MITLSRQRKLKEAREAAELEVTKYRREKELEFEKLKAEVVVELNRKLTRSSKKICSERPRKKSQRSRKIMKRTKTK
jgi:hypothetical protein